MSKNYQKAARGWLYALAAVIAGTCFSATPAQSATCFLPSGECSTGKIGAGPSGGESTPEYCVGYDITEKEYNAKYNNACWDCSDSCVKTSGGTFYKCKTVNNTTWYDKYNVCCTDGTKYDKDDGKCCAGGKCDHPCSGGKQWSPTLKQCVCPSNLETDGNGNCCASGQVLDENKNCTTPCTMNDCGSYPYTTDPGNSEKCNLGCNKGTRYKCKSGYTYSGGKCVEPPAPTPTPKCTDVPAIPNTDRINKYFDGVASTKHENVQDAELECGIPIQSRQNGFNSTHGSEFWLEQDILGPKYGLHNGKYYVKMSDCGGGCFDDYMCSSLAGEGYVNLISGTTGQYCCKGTFSISPGSYHTLSELNDTSKCKPRPDTSTMCGRNHHQPYYVCTKGTLSGTKCYSDPTFTCPTDYELLGEHYCISTKTKCPEGYKLDKIKSKYEYSCIGTTYTCPTNFDYTLSGGKCYCQKPAACLDYTLTSKKDENCYACATCPTDSSKYKCIENIKSGYQLVNGVCSKKPVEKPTITITLEYDSKNNTGVAGGESSFLKFTNSASDGKSYTVKLIIDGDGDNGINYPLTVTQGNWVTYSSWYWETSDCEVYGDCRGDDSDNGREFASNASDMSLMINNKTVQTGLPVTGLAGKTYETNDYKIKFAEVKKVQEPQTYTVTVKGVCESENTGGQEYDSESCVASVSPSNVKVKASLDIWHADQDWDWYNRNQCERQSVGGGIITSSGYKWSDESYAPQFANERCYSEGWSIELKSFTINGKTVSCPGSITLDNGDIYKCEKKQDSGGTQGCC